MHKVTESSSSAFTTTRNVLYLYADVCKLVQLYVHTYMNGGGNQTVVNDNIKIPIFWYTSYHST